MRAVLFALLVESCAAQGPLCMVVRDTAAGQDVRLEGHGADAIRVRAVPHGLSFFDPPDVVSALVEPSPSAECRTVDMRSGQSVTSGNLRASLSEDGILSFTRISDGALLLRERESRVLAPTTTTPPMSGFLKLQMSFEAVAGERLYGAWCND